MAFDRGHKFLNSYMEYMNKNYNPNARSGIGPIGFREAFRMMCNHSSMVVNDSVYDYRCNNEVYIKLFNKTVFHPIGYYERNRFYVENFTLSELRTFDISYLVHVYYSGHGVHLPNTCLFSYMAKQFCPSVYNQRLLGNYIF